MKSTEGIKTENLYLRELTMEDAEVLFNKWAGNKEMNKYLQWKPHTDISETKEFIRECIDGWINNEKYYYIAEIQDTGEVVGLASIKPDEGWKARLGCLVFTEYQNSGYASEINKGLTDESFKDPNIKRVWAVSDTENTPSAKALENAGLTSEGVLKKHIMCPNLSNEPRDAFMFAKVR